MFTASRTSKPSPTLAHQTRKPDDATRMPPFTAGPAPRPVTAPPAVSAPSPPMMPWSVPHHLYHHHHHHQQQHHHHYHHYHPHQLQTTLLGPASLSVASPYPQAPAPFQGPPPPHPQYSHYALHGYPVYPPTPPGLVYATYYTGAPPHGYGPPTAPYYASPLPPPPPR